MISQRNTSRTWARFSPGVWKDVPRILRWAMLHALSALLPGGICFFRPLTFAPPSACLAVGLPCIAFMAKVTTFPRST